MASDKAVNTEETSEVNGNDQVVNPFTATTGKGGSFDYERLIKEFGTTRMDSALIEKYERVTGQKAHHLIRRNVFFSHR